ncbi:MAG: hypothetical protein ABIP59_01025 [Roseateles sp.]
MAAVLQRPAVARFDELGVLPPDAPATQLDVAVLAAADADLALVELEFARLAASGDLDDESSHGVPKSGSWASPQRWSPAW